MYRKINTFRLSKNLFIRYFRNYLIKNSENRCKCRFWISKENSYRTQNQINAILKYKINSFLEVGSLDFSNFVLTGDIKM